MPPEDYVGWVAAGAFAVFALLLLSDEFRQRRIRAAERTDTVFRCRRCAMVYTDDPEVARSRCPQCGTTNEAFQF